MKLPFFKSISFSCLFIAASASATILDAPTESQDTRAVQSRSSLNLNTLPVETIWRIIDNFPPRVRANLPGTLGGISLRLNTLIASYNVRSDDFLSYSMERPNRNNIGYKININHEDQTLGEMGYLLTFGSDSSTRKILLLPLFTHEQIAYYHLYHPAGISQEIVPQRTVSLKTLDKRDEINPQNPHEITKVYTNVPQEVRGDSTIIPLFEGSIELDFHAFARQGPLIQKEGYIPNTFTEELHRTIRHLYTDAIKHLHRKS